MILRSLTVHVRTQNWFAVGLDLVIVVVGVFIGIQVSNWNDEQGRLAQERSYLILLHDELLQNNERSLRLLEYYTSVIEASERSLAYLEGEVDCEAGCEELLIDFFHATQLWVVNFEQTAFREATELGFPSDRALREALFTTYDLANSFGMINQVSPPFREAAREYIKPEAASILWAGCWKLDAEAVIESLTRDCATDLAAVDTTPMLREMRADSRLKRMLRYWINQNIVAMMNYPVMIDRTHASAGMVAAEIKAAP
jgi:hypothetical protein